MATETIEVKNNEGKRTTLSVDALLFKFYAKLCGGEKEARSEIRKALNGSIVNSQIANSILIHSIARPELLDEQIDIEDL